MAQEKSKLETVADSVASWFQPKPQKPKKLKNQIDPDEKEEDMASQYAKAQKKAFGGE